MGKEGLISVIVPVYNVEKYISECINSVLEQTYADFELILVNDGSKDKSGDICDEFCKRDQRITVIHQSNQGQGQARNVGLEYASGEYIFFLDSDDRILNIAFEKLMTLAKQEAAEVVFFDALSFSDDRNFSFKQTYVRKNHYMTDRGDKILQELYRNDEYRCSVPLLFIRKGFLDSINLFFETGMIYEDQVFTYILFFKANRITQLKEVLYERRYRENSTMTSAIHKKNFLSMKRVYEIIKDSSIEMGIAESALAKAFVSRFGINAITYFSLLNKEEKIECRSEFKRLRKQIIKDKAYADKELILRCHGIVPWIIYKCYQKISSLLQKGK